MRTRAAERAASAEPGPVQTRSRKRSASIQSISEVPAPPSQPAAKKAKTQTAVEHRVLSTLVEGAVPPPTGNQSSQLDEPPQQLVSDHKSRTTKKVVHRRVTISPSALSGSSDATNDSRSRRSLPSQLSTSSQITSQPLDGLIQERIRLRRERQSLSRLSEVPDEDLLVTADLDGPSQPSQPLEGKSLALHLTSEDSDGANSNPDSAVAVKSEHERLVFEDSIKQLATKAAEAQAALEILTVELRSMGFGEPHADSQLILKSIRDSFDQVRHRVRDVIPLEVSDDIAEKDLLLEITDRLLHLAQQNDANERIVMEKTNIEADLLVQIDALVERLTDAEIRRTDLETETVEYQTQFHADERFITGLQTKLKDVEEEHSKLRTLLQEKVARLEELEQDNARVEDNCDKLKTALSGYRESEQKLQQLIERLEEDHASAVEGINVHHAREVDSLTQNLDHEKQHRQGAETKAAEHSKQITTLQNSLARENTILKDLRAQIEQVRTEHLTDQTAKLEAEEELKEQSEKLDLLEEKFQDASDSIEALQIRLSKSTTHLAGEKHQREAAEAELDGALARAKDLETRLQKQGIHSNELRQKLFEIQHSSQEDIQQLKDETAALRTEHEAAIAAEVARREEVEDLADSRKDIIDQLKEQLAALDHSMRETLDAKEVLLQEIQDRATTLDESLDETAALLENKIVEYDEFKQNTIGHFDTMRSSIRSLEQNVADKEKTLHKVRESAAVQQAQMKDALHSRDNKIKSLESERADALARIRALENDKVSLERRVESEAEAMLTHQNSTAGQIKLLQSTIASKQAEIDDLNRKGVEAETAWKNAIASRDAATTEVQTTLEETEERLVVTQGHHDDLRQRFRDYAIKATAELDELYTQLAGLRAKAGAAADDLENRARSILGEAEDGQPINTGNSNQVVVVDGHQRGTTQVAGARDGAVKTATAVKRKSRRSTTKKVRDSGIGASSDLEPALA